MKEIELCSLCFEPIYENEPPDDWFVNDLGQHVHVTCHQVEVTEDFYGFDDPESF